jgi:hypothetical protein
MKKSIFVLFIFGFVLLFFINDRTPFLRQNAGPWSIGFGTSTNFPNKIAFEKNSIYPLEKLKKIDPRTEFLADPFFLKVQDTFYIFFEHKLLNSKAEIGVMTSTDGIDYQYRGTVLEQPFHLSYPQVFCYRNEYYMIPEAKGSNCVLLYKAKKFPFGWNICDTLIKNVAYADPSIYLSDTLNIMAVSGKNLQLLLYEADSLFGKWKLHKSSILNVGSEARCGGRFIKEGKELILPIQNSTHGYGYGVSLYALTFKGKEYQFKRKEPYFLKPQSTIREFNAGMHQFDIQKVNGKYYYVYDGNRLKNNNKHLNIRGTLKTNYLDFINLFN